MWASERRLEHIRMVYRAVGDEELIVHGVVFYKYVPSGETTFFEQPFTFTKPVYVGFNAPLDARQAPTQCTMVLLMAKADFVQLDNVMESHDHQGAFGTDWNDSFESTHPTLDTLLWKIPGDLRHIGSVRHEVTRNRAQPVGLYPNLLDQDTLDVTLQSVHYSLKDQGAVRFRDYKHESTATALCKWRYDFENGPAVHVLTDGTTTFPAINSLLWITGYWHTTPSELQWYRQVMRRLKDAGISAYSIRGQQHLLVFIADQHGPFTVAGFVERLKENDFYETLRKALCWDGFDEWVAQYLKFDLTAFVNGQWRSESGAAVPSPIASGSGSGSSSSASSTRFTLRSTSAQGDGFLRLDSPRLVAAGDASEFTLDHQRYLLHADTGRHVFLHEDRLLTQPARSAQSLRLDESMLVAGAHAVDIYNPSSPRIMSWRINGHANQLFAQSALSSTGGFIVTTFNALLDGFEDSGDRWVDRRDLSARKLKSRNSDIILWNEVQPHMMEYMKTEGVFPNYIIGNRGLSSDNPMQCAISFRNGIEILNIEEPLPFGKRCLVVTTQFEDERTVVFVAVHLKAGESQKSEEVRIKEMERILDHLESMPPADAFVVAGDFNSDPKLKSYYNSQLHDYLNTRNFTNLTGFHTTYHGWGPCQFDYVYGLGLRKTGAPIVDSMPLRAPNATQGSDHTPVTIGLKFKKE